MDGVILIGHFSMLNVTSLQQIFLAYFVGLNPLYTFSSTTVLHMFIHDKEATQDTASYKRQSEDREISVSLNIQERGKKSKTN